MKGLYINVPQAQRQSNDISALLGVRSEIKKIKWPGQDLWNNPHRFIWEKGVTFIEKKDFAIVVNGWFIYKGKVGNLSQFAEDCRHANSPKALVKCCQDISAGAFIILLRKGKKDYLITDPFGLHPHYYVHDGNNFRLAPSPYFLKEFSEKDALLERTCVKNNYLFGNYTAYKNIFRVNPGCIWDIKRGKSHDYYDYTPIATDLPHIEQSISEPLRLLSNYTLLLPLSGGLDSRYLLTFITPDYGYTYGPAGCMERHIARKFHTLFKKGYFQFSFRELAIPKTLADAATRIFDGLQPRPFFQILSVYKFISKKIAADTVFLDGYAGDPLFRNTFLKFKKPYILHVLSRALPLSVFLLPFNLFLKSVFPNFMRGPQKKLFLASYAKDTQRFHCNKIKQYLQYQFIYAGCGRNSLNGGGVMANQFFVSVQPFFFYKTYRYLIGMDDKKRALHRLVAAQWSEKDRIFTCVPATSTAYLPLNASPMRIRLTGFLIGIRRKILKQKNYYIYRDEL